MLLWINNLLVPTLLTDYIPSLIFEIIAQVEEINDAYKDILEEMGESCNKKVKSIILKFWNRAPTWILSDLVKRFVLFSRWCAYMQVQDKIQI